jgi:hypothetical protein
MLHGLEPPLGDYRYTFAKTYHMIIDNYENPVQRGDRLRTVTVSRAKWYIWELLLGWRVNKIQVDQMGPTHTRNTEPTT